MATARFILRKDSAANWTSENPVLEAGEPGFDTTNGELKIGDGVTAWADLDPISGDAPVLSVNGDTGVVVITAADLGAVEDDDPRLTDARTPATHGNEAHSATYVTAAGAAAAAPVQSVDGQTGAVTLSSSYAPKADVVTVSGTSETVDGDDDGTYRRYTSGSGCTVSLADGVAEGVLVVGRAVGGTVTVQDNGTSTVNGEGTVAAGSEWSAISVGSNTWDVVGTTA